MVRYRCGCDAAHRDDLAAVMWPDAEMASKILRRVSSARAFEIFSISNRFIDWSEYSEASRLAPRKPVFND
jgi:hypothetical protein